MLNFCQDNAFENIACKILAILSRPRHIDDIFLHVFLPHVCRRVFQTLALESASPQDWLPVRPQQYMFDSPAPLSKAAVGSIRKQDAGVL